MRLNENGDLEYHRYGSIRGYNCRHCGLILVAENSRGKIYDIRPTYFKDGSGRVKCSICNNIAVAV